MHYTRKRTRPGFFSGLTANAFEIELSWKRKTVAASAMFAGEQMTAGDAAYPYRLRQIVTR